MIKLITKAIVRNSFEIGLRLVKKKKATFLLKKGITGIKYMLKIFCILEVLTER